MTMTTEERKAYDQGIRDAMEVVEKMLAMSEMASDLDVVAGTKDILDALRAKLEE